MINLLFLLCRGAGVILRSSTGELRSHLDGRNVPTHSRHCDVFPRTAFETAFAKIVGGMFTKIRWKVKGVLKRKILEIAR
jgi:hypothetical protein